MWIPTECHYLRLQVNTSCGIKDTVQIENLNNCQSGRQASNKCVDTRKRRNPGVLFSWASGAEASSSVSDSACCLYTELITYEFLVHTQKARRLTDWVLLCCESTSTVSFPFIEDTDRERCSFGDTMARLGGPIKVCILTSPEVDCSLEFVTSRELKRKTDTGW